MANSAKIKTLVDEAKAAETEELNDVVFTYDGEEYTLPHPQIWPMEAMEAQEAGKLSTAVREILGEDQYAKLRKKSVKTAKDINDFTAEMFEAIELQVGK